MEKVAPFIHAIGSGSARCKHPVEVFGSRIYHRALFDALLGWAELGFELTGGGFLGGQADKFGNKEASSCKMALVADCAARIHDIKLRFGEPFTTHSRHLDRVKDWLKSAKVYEEPTNMEMVVGTIAGLVEELDQDVLPVIFTDEPRRQTVITELLQFCNWQALDTLNVIGLPRPDNSFGSLPWVQTAKCELAKQLVAGDYNRSLSDLTAAWQEKEAVLFRVWLDSIFVISS